MMILYKVLTLFIILFNISTFTQTTYYVSGSGSDTNDGLTPQTAFETIQHAADMVSAGDSVLVLEGNYIGFDIRTNGSQNSQIVFKAIEDNVVIDQRNAVTPDGINIENASCIIIDGFEVKNQPRAESVLRF